MGQLSLLHYWVSLSRSVTQVEHVLDGGYDAPEIVVDHPACGGDVFATIPVGTNVHLTVRAMRKYNVITYWPGIREQDEQITMFYVAASTIALPFE